MALKMLRIFKKILFWLFFQRAWFCVNQILDKTLTSTPPHTQPYTGSINSNIECGLQMFADSSDIINVPKPMIKNYINLLNATSHWPGDKDLYFPIIVSWVQIQLLAVHSGLGQATSPLLASLHPGVNGSWH